MNPRLLVEVWPAHEPLPMARALFAALRFVNDNLLGVCLMAHKSIPVVASRITKN